MADQSIYTVGGTVQAGGGIYIKRKADDELLHYCRAGEFAFILSSRQVGKSSLMVRTAQQLEQESIRSVTIDLSAIGVKVSQDEWYLGILNEISASLNLKTDIFSWWTQYAQLGSAQRLSNFFRDVLLKEVKEKVVLFFDEIDSTLSIPFSDDFYIALRAIYNARSTVLDFKRLSFVLVGVAAPSDLISDNKRTPFNIGRRVEINDFTFEEALPLADGLGQQATQVLKWVFLYTSGHPYLTQRLCAQLAKSKEIIDEQTVVSTVERLFTGEEGRQDNNLQFVRDMLSKRSPDVMKVLAIYKNIRSGKKVADDERSITQAHLKLSGLVRSEHGLIHVRNGIYNTVFNLRWIQENTPKNSQRIALITLGATLGIVILTTLTIFIHDFFVGSKVNSSIANFISATSPTQRLADLAQIYRQKGILSNTDSSLSAAQLYYSLSAKDQLSIFTDYTIDQNPELQNDLVVVISHLYVTVADVNSNEDNIDLLEAMRDSLSKASNNSAGLVIQNEITAWLNGREQVRQGNYQEALKDYNRAIDLNPENQATRYERAKVYIGLEDYVSALKDLDSVIGLAKQSAPDDKEVFPTLTASLLPATAISTSNTDEVQTQALPGITNSGSTVVPSKIGLTPTKASLATLESKQSLTPTPSPTYIPIARYESRFTTLIDVINAVQALIDKTPQLQVVAQSNGDSIYTNLQSYKLILIVSSIGYSITDGTTVLYVPAGTFKMGSANGNSDEQPVHEVTLDAFWIDQTEVTNKQYKACVDAGKCVLPSNSSSSTHPSYYGNPVFDDYPVVNVDWNKANVYCSWAGRRLPTEAEWEKAARGTDGRIYPWGNTAPSKDLLNYNSIVGDTTKVGSYSTGKSFYGAYDMAGNIWEWVNDWYSETYYKISPSLNPLGPSTGQQRVLRGNGWKLNTLDPYSAVRAADFPSRSYYDTGFRCATSVSK